MVSETKRGRLPAQHSIDINNNIAGYVCVAGCVRSWILFLVCRQLDIDVAHIRTGHRESTKLIKFEFRQLDSIEPLTNNHHEVVVDKQTQRFRNLFDARKIKCSHHANECETWVDECTHESQITNMVWKTGRMKCARELAKRSNNILRALYIYCHVLKAERKKMSDVKDTAMQVRDDVGTLRSQLHSYHFIATNGINFTLFLLIFHHSLLCLARIQI